ncbi:hypothetical protein C8F04DRAFT_1315545 [Mycena alexandri]|uniref:Uncharacterized protein n=1 Tax=Mycena alexandri TaxID=1745969 RepID=A0AAD6S718_9AGAR|nr:hypothetical protein C8F04DRAFT_1315545 [Mycena alexandri]
MFGPQPKIQNLEATAFILAAPPLRSLGRRIPSPEESGFTNVRADVRGRNLVLAQLESPSARAPPILNIQASPPGNLAAANLQSSAIKLQPGPWDFEASVRLRPLTSSAIRWVRGGCVGTRTKDFGVGGSSARGLRRETTSSSPPSRSLVLFNGATPRACPDRCLCCARRGLRAHSSSATCLPPTGEHIRSPTRIQFHNEVLASSVLAGTLLLEYRPLHPDSLLRWIWSRRPLEFWNWGRRTSAHAIRSALTPPSVDVECDMPGERRMCARAPTTRTNDITGLWRAKGLLAQEPSTPSLLGLRRLQIHPTSSLRHQLPSRLWDYGVGVRLPRVLDWVLKLSHATIGFGGRISLVEKSWNKWVIGSIRREPARRFLPAPTSRATRPPADERALKQSTSSHKPKVPESYHQATTLVRRAAARPSSSSRTPPSTQDAGSQVHRQPSPFYAARTRSRSLAARVLIHSGHMLNSSSPSAPPIELQRKCTPELCDSSCELLSPAPPSRMSSAQEVVAADPHLKHVTPWNAPFLSRSRILLSRASECARVSGNSDWEAARALYTLWARLRQLDVECIMHELYSTAHVTARSIGAMLSARNQLVCGRDPRPVSAQVFKIAGDGISNIARPLCCA